MDLQYGIAVTNKFALFTDEEEDPLEVLKLKEEELKNSKKDDKTKKTKSGKKSAPIEIKPKLPEQQAVKREDKPNQQVRSERGSFRGGRGRELRENDGSRPPRRQGPRDNRDGFKGDENVPPEFRDRGDGSNRRERGEGGFERGRGRGGGRGRGSGRGGPRGPRPDSGRGGGFGGSGERRREFDRHSGTDKTGVKPVDKRDGGGAHNWGSYKDDVEEQAAAPVQADESGEWAAAPVEQPETTELNESGEAAAPKEDDEAKVMTLDEWKTLQDQKRMKATFNIRKAGEGVDNAQWKKGVAYTKKKEDSDEEESDDEEEDDRHGHRKQFVTDIRITFADNPRRGGRGGRGGRGRGGPRGEGRGGPRGGGRGEFRGERSERPPRGGPRESAPRMDDETDFPKLVKPEA